MTSTASSFASLPERNRAVSADQVDQLKAMITERDATIQTLTAALESLRQQVLALRRAQFGASSERIEGQAELFAETVSLPLPPVQSETITYERERRGRPALPKNLPRVRVEYDLTDAEKNDFETLTRIGEDKSETLDYIPAKLQVIEHVRVKYAATRKADGGQTVVSASMPPAPLPKSNASANLLSHVLVSKFADHLPLNRIEGILERHGAAIARSTLSDWVLGSTELLSVVYEAMKIHVLAAPKIHADDTILPLCEQGRGRTVQARLWAYLGAGSTRANEQSEWIEYPAAVFYEFTDDRRGEHVQQMLKAYRGYLQADAYAGFDALYKDGRILEVACWAHARRKFFEIADAAPKDTRTAAHDALDWIVSLYMIERAIADEPPDKKHKIRQAQSAPMLADFKIWLEGKLRTILPRSATAGAIGYALNQWAALCRYTDSGILDIDNNACERAMRPVALGRKNFLFVGSDRGGRAAAVAYSLIETCKLHGVEPYAYLADVLRRLPAHPVNRVAELLPFRWKPAA